MVKMTCVTGSFHLFIFYTIVHQHARCGRANSVCDLKTDEHKAKNMPKYAECVDTDIKMKCQNRERENQSRNAEEREKDRRIKEKFNNELERFLIQLGI